jgi:hypothetical protein
MFHKMCSGLRSLPITSRSGIAMPRHGVVSLLVKYSVGRCRRRRRRRRYYPSVGLRGQHHRCGRSNLLEAIFILQQNYLLLVDLQ